MKNTIFAALLLVIASCGDRIIPPNLDNMIKYEPVRLSEYKSRAELTVYQILYLYKNPIVKYVQ